MLQIYLHTNVNFRKLDFSQNIYELIYLKIFYFLVVRKQSKMLMLILDLKKLILHEPNNLKVTI